MSTIAPAGAGNDPLQQAQAQSSANQRLDAQAKIAKSAMKTHEQAMSRLISESFNGTGRIVSTTA